MSPSPPSPEVTVLLRAAAGGDPAAAERVLPLLYDELRALAAARLRQTPPGNTLQATALVHEAYLRLVGPGDPGWDGRHHFFGAAARAMRDILVDQARSKAALKRAGDRRRVALEPDAGQTEQRPEDVLAVHEALQRLEAADPAKAELVMLRYFGGLTLEQIAELQGVSTRTVDRSWRFARSWLQRDLGSNEGEKEAGSHDAGP